jgi:hypothetical protein
MVRHGALDLKSGSRIVTFRPLPGPIARLLPSKI